MFLFSFLVSFFFLFSFSCFSVVEPSPCRFYKGGIHTRKQLSSGVTLQSWEYGSVGNHVVCAKKAMEEAILCNSLLKIPNFQVLTRSSPSSLLFDFKGASQSIGKNCLSSHEDNCENFYFQNNSNLSPNQTKILWQCMGELINLNYLECPPGDMENKLLIHIRNGDIFLRKDSPYLQPQFSALLGPIYVRRWKELIVMTSVREPFERLSGPIYDLFHALKIFFPDPIFIPHTTRYEDHLKYWFCAENLLTSFSTLNNALQVHRNVKTLFTPAFDCLPKEEMLFLKEPFQQYRVPSSVHQFFWDGEKYTIPNEEDSLVKYVLTPSELYTLCPIKKEKKLLFENEGLFRQWRHIFSLPQLLYHEDLSDSLVVDFVGDNGGGGGEIAIPFCGVFGAIMFQNWKRVIVLEYPISNETKVGLLNQVLLDAIRMIVGSIPVKFDFVPARFRNELKIVNIVMVPSSSSSENDLKKHPSIQKVFDPSGRDCVQKSLVFKNLSFYGTKTRNPVKFTRSSILFSQCISTYQSLETSSLSSKTQKKCLSTSKRSNKENRHRKSGVNGRRV